MDEALSAHRSLIEKFVAEAPSISARLVRSEAIFSRAQDCASMNQFVQSLGAAERETLARMLEQARVEAIFDSLRVLHEASALEGLQLFRGGNMIPLEPYGYSLFEEFLTVLQDRSWAALGG